VDIVKKCKWCGELKPVQEFHKNPRGRDGRRAECKSCTASYRKRRYAENREQEIERVGRWQRENAERLRAYRREYNKRPERKAAMRELHLKRTFGMTQAEYDAMLERQGGVCAICFRPPPDGISLHVDHEHATGRIRGLTCFPCNNALGLLQEDPARFARLAGYLDEHDPEVQAQAEIIRRRAYALVGR
jgi:hypothetical protein